MIISYLILTVVMAIIAIVLVILAREAKNAKDKNSKKAHAVTSVMAIIAAVVAVVCGFATTGALTLNILKIIFSISVGAAVVGLIAMLICRAKGKIVLTWTFFLIMVVFAVFAIGGNVASAFASETTSESTDAKVNIDTIKQATADLTVDLDSLDASKYSWCSMELLESSLTTKDSQRVTAAGFSDALTFGFSGSDKLKEVQEEILRNPVYGVGLANFLKDLKVGSTSIGSLNPWMGEMVSKNTSVNYWLRYKDSTKTTIVVNDEYRTYAVGLCDFLNLMVDKGVQERTTSENWCLNCSAKSSARAAVKANYQYTRDTWVLQYIGKDDSVLLEFGLNIHDKRYELFAESEVVVVTTSSSGGSSGGGGSTPTPTPTPSNPVKDPSKDPVYQGNADVGGGKNLPTDGTGEFQPTEPELEDYVPPNNNSSGDNNSSSGSGSESSSGDGATPPATDPIPVHEDSHDTEEQGAGNNNGEFSMD